MIRDKLETINSYQTLLNNQLKAFNEYIEDEDKRIKAAVLFALRWIQSDFASEITISTTHMTTIVDKTLLEIQSDKLDDFGTYKTSHKQNNEEINE